MRGQSNLAFFISMEHRAIERNHEAIGSTAASCEMSRVDKKQREPATRQHHRQYEQRPIIG
jgi:hypothetical protein